MGELDGMTFDEINESRRSPGHHFEIDPRAGSGTLPSNRKAALIIGQKTTSGTAEAGKALKVFSIGEGEELFGPGSICHMMIKTAIKENPNLALSVIGLSDAVAGVAASGTATVTGTATSVGTIVIYVGNSRIPVRVDVGDTPTDVAAKIVAAVNAVTDLPVTAANALGVVTFTAKNKGTVGNSIHLAYSQDAAAGVTVAIVAMASGATDPDIETVLAGIAGEEYNVIIIPYSNATAMGLLKTHADTVSNATNLKPCVGFCGMTGSYSDATTLATALNHKRSLIAWLRYTDATKRQSLPAEIAAFMGAVAAGNEDPAKPLDYKESKTLALPAVEDKPSGEEEDALHNGVTPLVVGAGGRVQIHRAVLTYTKNAAGVADDTFLDYSDIDIPDYGIKAIRAKTTSAFAGAKMPLGKAEDATEGVIFGVLKQLEDEEILENVDALKPLLQCSRSGAVKGRMLAKVPMQRVPGYHQLFAKVQLVEMNV